MKNDKIRLEYWSFFANLIILLNSCVVKMNNNSEKLNKKRPLSPHLTIYKPQITSVLSILHRMTGVALYFGLIIFCWWLVSVTYSDRNAHFIMWPIFDTLIWKICVFGWSISLFYHMLNGIRHLFWDAGYGFSLNATTISGWIVVGGTIALTAISWSIVFFG